MPPGDGNALQPRRYAALRAWVRRLAAGGRGLRAQPQPSADVAPGALEQPSLLDELAHVNVIERVEGEMRRLTAANHALTDQLARLEATHRDLTQSERRLRATLLANPAPLLETDAVGTVVQCNPSAGELIGCPPADLIGKPIWQLAASEDVRERLRAAFLPRARIGRGAHETRIAAALRRSDGEILETEVLHAWVRDDRKRIVGSIASLLDVTAVTRAEADARARALAYRDLYDRAPALLLTVDAKTTTVLECNEAVIAATGYRREELLDRSVFDLYDAASLEDAAESFRRFLHDAESNDVKLWVKRKDGSHFPVLESCSAVADEGGAILACRMVWQETERRARPRQALRAARAS